MYVQLRLMPSYFIKYIDADPKPPSLTRAHSSEEYELLEGKLKAEYEDKLKLMEERRKTSIDLLVAEYDR